MLDGCTKFSGKAAVRNNDDANHVRMSILLTFAGRRLPCREPAAIPEGPHDGQLPRAKQVERERGWAAFYLEQYRFGLAHADKARLGRSVKPALFNSVVQY
jgi:hypothetical protein